MTELQQTLIAHALNCQALQFGDFTLKSGRKSPYFFNLGQFSDGAGIALLGKSYADHLQASGAEFDMLFGPAYKGIPLVSVTAMALANDHQRNLPFCYNRKEVKDHGEGGQLVGAPLAGKVWLIDDVLTAGTAAQASIEMIQIAGAEVAGLIVAFDRQEAGSDGDAPASSQLADKWQIPVLSLFNKDNLLDYLKAHDMDEALGYFSA